MLNKVFLIGNLGRDPEIRHFEGGGMVTKFPIATNENYQDRNGEWQTRTEWHDIICWGRLAERAEKSLQKGNLIFIEGKITKRKWQDKEGNDRYSVEIVSNTFKLLERRETSDRGYENNFPSVEDQFPSYDQTPKTQENQLSSSETDDLPF